MFCFNILSINSFFQTVIPTAVTGCFLKDKLFLLHSFSYLFCVWVKARISEIVSADLGDSFGRL